MAQQVMNAAVLVVPGAAAGMVAVDAGPMLDIPVAAVGLASVDCVPGLGISEVVADRAVAEPQQVVGMVKFLNHVHNVYNSSLALNSGHNRGSA